MKRIYVFQVINCCIYLILILITSVNVNIKLVECCPRVDPDENRDSVEIIKARGFVPEVHYVTTQDGYIVTLHRIINPTIYSNSVDFKPVLIQHGLFGSSSDFIINSPFQLNESFNLHDINNKNYLISNKITDDYNDANVKMMSGPIDNNLGFSLSIRGYDVWLGNSRGNNYSQNHTKLNPEKDKKYWEFSFDEMSKFDLPACIDYILNVTSRKSLAYIGHSQGTAIMFGLLSMQPHFSEIINPFIALAPVTSVGHMTTPLKNLAPLKSLLRLKGGKFFPPSSLIKYLSEIICKQEYRFICENLLFLATGFDPNQMNMTRLPVYLSHTPSDTSSWDVAHFFQMIFSKRFCMFDYGKEENQVIYGQSSPPDYPLEQINSTKIALIYSMNDWLADLNDIVILKSKLKVKLLDDYMVPYEQWTHIDYLFGINAGKYVYSKVIEILSTVDQQHENNIDIGTSHNNTINLIA